MTPYRNLGENSNIVAYEITENTIQVIFRCGRYRNYLYDSVRPGSAAVEKMKILAEQGRGLNAYISSVIKGRYARKW